MPQSRGEPLFLKGRKNLFRGGGCPPPPFRRGSPSLPIGQAAAPAPSGSLWRVPCRSGVLTCLFPSLPPCVRTAAFPSNRSRGSGVRSVVCPGGCGCFLSGWLFRLLVISLPKPSADRASVPGWAGSLASTIGSVGLYGFPVCSYTPVPVTYLICLYDFDPAVWVRAIRKTLGVAERSGCRSVCSCEV